MNSLNEAELLRDHEKRDAELRDQEAQVESIIKMIKEEFNLSNEEINSEKSGDTGFEDFSGTNSNEKSNTASEKLSEDYKTESNSENYEDDYLNLNDFTDESERKSFDEINDFIQKAIEFGANALDLSKKNLKKIPLKLVELRNLQYIYMEGNQLTKLPENFFQIFTQLTWLDLRNNILTEIPTAGLDKHENLRYILLENNQITRLPCQIANLRNLTAINLTGNPIEYPPLDVVQKGCKPILEFMKNDYALLKLNQDNDSSYKSNEYESNDYRSLIDDVWASDDETDSKLSKSQKSIKNRNNRTKPIVSRSYLIAKPMRPSDAQLANSDLKERLNKAKINANKLRKPLAPNEISVYKNEEYEKAARAGKLEKYKKEKEKIDAKLQKLNDKEVRDEFREDLKKEQRKMYGKRLIKGVDFIEPIHNAPFDISEDHMQVMTNEERAILDKKLALERMRSLSPETLWRIEEERRLRDHMLQDKIREYTNKLLARRNDKSLNPKYDKLQAAKDIRELKAIHREIEQRRYEMQYNIRAYTGGLVFRETAKLNARGRIGNVLKAKK